MNNCSVVNNHSSYPRRSLWFSTLISVVVNPIPSPCKVNLLFILIDDGYFFVVFYPISGRCNPLLDGYHYPIFGIDIPSFFWIIARIKQLYPQRVLFHLPFAGDVCYSPLFWAYLPVTGDMSPGSLPLSMYPQWVSSHLSFVVNDCFSLWLVIIIYLVLVSRCLSLCRSIYPLLTQ